MNSGKDRKDVHNSDVPNLCRACEARHKGICGALTPEQLLYLSKHTSKRVATVESEISAIGEETRNYSNILQGVVKLTKLMADGRQQIVGLQFAPDFVGRPFENTNALNVEAATNVRLCSFPKKVLEELISKSPDLEHRLHQQNLKELSEARDWMLTLGRKTASEKVASFLHLIATHIDPDRLETEGERRFELPLKRADIADFLGLTIETVSRQMTKLRKAGIIELEDNRHVFVPDMERLESACEQQG